MRLTCFLFLMLLSTVALAVAPPVHWSGINANPHYQIEGRGTPLDEAGAQVAVVAVDAVETEFGGAITRIDAEPFLEKQLVLSAGLATRGAASGASIWIRVDGEAETLEFASSQSYPVSAGQAPVRREVALRVPPGASGIVFGVVLQGGGTLEASHLRLRIDDVPPSRATAGQVLDSAIAIIRENALHAERADWRSLAATLAEQHGNDARAAEAAYPAIRQLLAALGDGHSLFIPPSEARQAGTSGAAKTAPVVQLLDGGVGYILLPGFVGQGREAGRAFSQSIVAAMAGIAPAAAGGWVVDLRRNAGGNMWPMMAAMRPLLDAGSTGGIRDRRGVFREWRDARPEYDAGPALDLGDARVAVLLGADTASSGEAIAVAFHGRPHARSFGQPTFGQSTSNATYALPDGSRIAVTTAVDVDRNGVAFGGKLQPDEPVAPDDGGDDRALAAAMAWLAGDAAGDSARD